ncbi:Uncharacterised protein [Serratia marcescens]|jgi:hypothetical protein|nr:hypothetical protein SM14BL09_41910 [Serratia marcescens]BEM11668.1 hypothetical protein SM14VA5_41720 [Serratia marcescens]CAI1868565.1 Uncharacterised protein [Serratia marcescens]CAI1903425.1 Uncharacterised protein [Serratia marcescens]
MKSLIYISILSSIFLLSGCLSIGTHLFNK